MVSQRCSYLGFKLIALVVMVLGFVSSPLFAQDFSNTLKVGSIFKVENRLRGVLEYERRFSSHLSGGFSVGYFPIIRDGVKGNQYHLGLELRYYIGMPKKVQAFLVAYAGYDRQQGRILNTYPFLYKRYENEYGLGAGLRIGLGEKLLLDGSLLPGFEPTIKTNGYYMDGRIFSRHVQRNFITIYAKLTLGYAF